MELDDVKAKSAEAFGSVADLSYITKEIVDADNKRNTAEPFGDNKSLTATVWYGNNARYGARTVDGVTYQGYWFENDGAATLGGICSEKATGFVTVDWHHKYLGKCPNGREKWSFTFG